jgi:hypothetical protein
LISVGIIGRDESLGRIKAKALDSFLLELLRYEGEEIAEHTPQCEKRRRRRSFKAGIGGSNVVGLAPNLVTLFLT